MCSPDSALCLNASICEDTSFICYLRWFKVLNNDASSYILETLMRYKSIDLTLWMGSTTLRNK